MHVQIETIESQPFGENSYILWLEGSSEAIVVDPGFEPEVIVEFLLERGLSVAAILNTHGHVDHIAGNRALKEAFPDAPIIIGHGDAEMLIDADLNLSAGFGMPVISPPAERTVHEAETVSVAGMDFLCWEIPGHSPGHVVFYLHGQQPGLLLGGDVLFRGSIGRTDFPRGNHAQLLKGIREKLWVLPEDVVVYPGHGPVTTIGHEKRTNPFVGGMG